MALSTRPALRSMPLAARSSSLLVISGVCFARGPERTQRRLRAANCPDLVDQVKPVALIEGDGLGDDHGPTPTRAQRLWIEVKMTNGRSGAPYAVTANEPVSRLEPARFRLYRVFAFSWDPRVYILAGDLGAHVDLEPTQSQLA